MTRVFISSSHDTEKLAQELSTALEQAGIPTWLDFKELSPGDRIDAKVEDAIQRSNVFLILFSNQWHGPSPWQDAEWQVLWKATLRDPDMKIVPLLIDRANAPTIWRNWVPLRIESDKFNRDQVASVIGRVAEKAGGNEARLSPEERQAFLERMDLMEQAAKSLLTADEPR
jgi:TIR domain